MTQKEGLQPGFVQESFPWALIEIWDPQDPNKLQSKNPKYRGKIKSRARF